MACVCALLSGLPPAATSAPAQCIIPSPTLSPEPRAPGAGINHPAAVLEDEPIACLAAGDHRGNHTACRPLRAGGGGDATLRQRFIYLILLGWDFFFFHLSNAHQGIAATGILMPRRTPAR